MVRVVMCHALLASPPFVYPSGGRAGGSRQRPVRAFYQNSAGLHSGVRMAAYPPADYDPEERVTGVDKRLTEGAHRMTSLTEQQIGQSLAGISDWKPVDVAGQPGIERVIRTGDFLSGLALVTRIAVLAEKRNHHPDVILTYPRVTIRLTTHDAGGLTEKDFDLATEIDRLVAR